MSDEEPKAKSYDDMNEEERKAFDAKERAREKEEQAALPYQWRQELGDVDVTVPVPKGTRGKDLDVKIGKKSLSVGLKGKEKILEGELCKEIKIEDSTWTLEDQTMILIHLEKVNKMAWWENVLTHHPKIDTTKIQPENSKLSDLDGETRGMVEKMMFDNQQKQMGKPTSDELKKMEMLTKFQAMHPEMDFSKAKISVLPYLLILLDPASDVVPPTITVTYKVVEGLPIKADIYLPPTNANGSKESHERSVLVQFHAGGATSGNRESYFPEWLRASAVAQGYIFISADNRLLQPSTGHDIISDVRDLFVWLSGPTAELNDEIVCNPGRLRIGNPPKIGVVGTSGGDVPGYLAALYAEPKPVVFLAMYCMTGNFYTPRYILPKTEVFFQGKPLLDVDADERLIPYLSIPTPIPGISDSPLVYNKDGTSANIRTLLTRLFLQQALYLDVLTGHAGLSASLSLSVLDRVPSENDFTTEQKKLIPMFNFTRDFPPTCLVHGTGDTAILFEESDAVATRLADLGVESEFVKVPGADHLFDLFEGVEKYKEYTDRAFGFLRKYLD